MTKLLSKITFTGIDQYTDKSDLVNLSQQFPNIEFGLLTAQNWNTNSTRYPNPSIIKDLYDQHVNYSLHLCGRFARKALINDYTEVHAELQNTLQYYSRLQINVSNMPVKPKYFTTIPHDNIKQLIVQTSTNKHMDLFNHLATTSNNLAPLFDMSGGRGIYNPITAETFNFNAPYYGIAGGITESNCNQVVEDIISLDKQQRPFWIDMETGVRDQNDKFSIQKCYNICEKLKTHIL